MAFVRTAQPSKLVLPGIKVEAYGTATAMPIGISKDRKTIYGAAKGADTVLRQSVDDGATWTTVKTFNDRVMGLVETDDGEAVCYTATGGNPVTLVYKSTGWSTSHTTATWALTLTTPGGLIFPAWGGAHTWAFGNDLIAPNTSKYGVMQENGPQTTGTGDQTLAARRVYFTQNYGTSWAQVFDVYTYFGNPATVHMHGSAYDPWWDRIWITIGDNPTASVGTGFTLILYSDDHGTTWNKVPQPTGWSGQYAQSITIAPLKDRILFGADNYPGLFSIPRKGYRSAGDLQWHQETAGGLDTELVSKFIYQNRNQPGAPLFIGHDSRKAEIPGAIYVSLDDGATIVQAWEDPAIRASGKGPTTVFGPTYNGKLVCWINQTGDDPPSGTHWLMRGELVVPEPGMMDASLAITGNAATTVFNYAHGLGIKPTRVIGWPEKPVTPTYTVTADATNIIVTFATAPAVGSYPFALRYAA